MMNNNVFLMAALAIVVASSVILVGGIGVQPAEASSGLTVLQKTAKQQP